MNKHSIAAAWKHLLVCTLITVLIPCGWGSNSTLVNDTSYTAVIDAGSSGSRLYLYKSNPNNSFVTIQELMSKKVSKGLSSYSSTNSSDPNYYENAGPSGIQPLLDNLTSYLAENNISKDRVLVNLLATAGMRLLEASSPAVVPQIYQSVTSSITSSGYRVGDVQTVTPRDEGLYSWADANYLNGSLQNKTTTNGVIEIGGASAQVVYLSSDTTNSNVVKKKINGVTYPIFSISYLGLGQDEARKAMINAGSTTSNPCYTSDHTFLLPVKGISQLTGSYDFNACKATYLNHVINSFNIPATAITAGFSETKFYGIGGSINGGMKNWKMVGQPLVDLENKIKSDCPTTWNNFQGTYGDSAFIQGACANGTYMSTFLFDSNALKLDGNQITAAEQINGTEATWTRGYIVISKYSNEI